MNPTTVVESSETKDINSAMEQCTNDEDQLAALGHVQELRREFSLWSIWCLQISLMATWESVSTASQAALQNGGPVCLLYNLYVSRRPSRRLTALIPKYHSLVSFIGTMFVVLSLGEISSIYPTAGGMAFLPSTAAHLQA